ncbi:hypothetical protein H9P43_001904 [Blastocladiella emersonii ATCC 22665]|nr:hypothetical protein H9P43_001904 [Blastocladiella emersonii ATCC 22665]
MRATTLVFALVAVLGLTATAVSAAPAEPEMSISCSWGDCYRDCKNQCGSGKNCNCFNFCSDACPSRPPRPRP